MLPNTSHKLEKGRVSLFGQSHVFLHAFFAAALAACGGEPGADETESANESRTEAAAALTTAELRDLALTRTNSLKTVDAPDAPNMKQFVADRTALRTLGKALFWDQQVGSDGQACASCHFHAGADNRSKHQVNPGLSNKMPGANPNAFGESTGFGPNGAGFGPNMQLKENDFPLHKLSDPDNRNSTVLFDSNDVISSQGVFNATFKAVGLPYDAAAPSLGGFGAVFNVDGVLVRNVEPRNTPTVLNVAFNHRSFWDGRGRPSFNGANPIGELDPGVRIVKASKSAQKTQAALVTVRVENSSAASQAVGPALSVLEMTFAGRRFADIGRKVLMAKPLAMQYVDKEDSILGTSSLFPNKGISASYVDLIKKAFQPTYWDAPGWIVELSSGKPTLKKQTAPSKPNQYTVMEYNFSLFFGLAIEEYEKQLVSDDAPFDRFMEGDDNALTPVEQAGLEIFLTKGRCSRCHSGPVFTAASFESAGAEPMKRMTMGDGGVAVYDNGHYNIGVRPTGEDIGLGGRVGPNNSPISYSRGYQEVLRALVDSLMASNPLLDQETAIRQANILAKVPRIHANPAGAATLLGAADPKAADIFEQAESDLSTAAADLPPIEILLKTEVQLILGEANAFLTQADELLTATPPNPNDAALELMKAHEALRDAADLLDAAPALVAQLDAGAALLAPGISLLPDPIDPGPDPDKPFGPPLRPEERAAVDGAFKAPSLRNVELTAPYFHNGGAATLEQVVDYYNRGGDFAETNQADLDPGVRPLGLTIAERAALVAFLKSLTDPRVRRDQGPFDHPSIELPNGGTVGAESSAIFGVPVLDDHFTLPAVGASGSDVSYGTPETPFANFLQPLSTP
jgi:cytochrome c peroxidase